MLSDLGAHVIDADALVHELQRKGTPVWAGIVAEFGEEILRADGEIDRAKLGALVFSDPEALHRLESIVHPAVGAEIEQATFRPRDLRPPTSESSSSRPSS